MTRANGAFYLAATGSLSGRNNSRSFTGLPGAEVLSRCAARQKYQAWRRRHQHAVIWQTAILIPDRCRYCAAGPDDTAHLARSSYGGWNEMQHKQKESSIKRLIFEW